MTPRQTMIAKYLGYQETGHSVFTVTLSTYVKERLFPPEEMFRDLWDNHFIHKVRKRLPLKAKLDHDYVIELSPPIPSEGKFNCFYGYHGFLVLESAYAPRIYANGELNKHLVGALRSFSHRGRYRPFCVNSFLIEPAKDIESWVSYITKTSNPKFSFS